MSLQRYNKDLITRYRARATDLSEEAFFVYNSAIVSVKGGLQQCLDAFAHLRESPLSSCPVRGKMLLFRDGEGATWEELFVGRMMFDLPGEVLFHLLQDCSLTPLNNPSSFVAEEAISQDCLESLLKTSCLIALKSSLHSREDLALFGHNGVKGAERLTAGFFSKIHGAGRLRNGVCRRRDTREAPVPLAVLYDLDVDFEKRNRVLQGLFKKAHAEKEKHPEKTRLAWMDMAEAAYKETADKMPADAIGIKDWTWDFGDRLATVVEKHGYLDVMAKHTSEAEAGHGRPVVTTHPIGAPGEKGFKVWTIDNPFTQVKMAEITRRIDQLIWMRTEGGGKQKRFCRIPCRTKESSPFFVSRKLYGGTKELDTFDTEMFEVAQMLADLQEHFVRVISGDKQGKITFSGGNLFNMSLAAIQLAVYGAHDDCSPLTTAGDNEECIVSVGDNHRLPTRSELQSLTFCMTNQPPADAENEEEPSCRITWFKVNDDGSDGPDVGHVNTGSCSFHWQGPGSQFGYKHKVSCLPQNRNHAKWRLLLGFRLSVDPAEVTEEDYKNLLRAHTGQSDDPMVTMEKDYRYKNVLQHITDVRSGDNKLMDIRADRPSSNARRRFALPVRPKKVSENAKGHKTEPGPKKGKRRVLLDLNGTVHRDRHPTMASAQYKVVLEELGIERPGPTVEMCSALYESLTTRHVVRKLLLDEGVLVDVAHSVAYMADANKDIKPVEDARDVGIGLPSMRRRRRIKPKQVTKSLTVVVPALYEVTSNTAGAVEGATQLPLMGESFTSDSICLDAGLNHGNMSHKIMSTEEGRHCILVLTRPYKNNTVMIREAISKAKQVGSHLLQVRNDTGGAGTEATAEVEKWLETMRAESLPDIEIYGSGGAPSRAGEFAPNLSTSTKGDAWMKISSGQFLEETNFLLEEYVRQEKIVSVFINEDTFGSEGASVADDAEETEVATVAQKKSRKTEPSGVAIGGEEGRGNLLFIGSYYFAESAYRSDTLEEYEDYLSKVPGVDRHWVLFRLSKYRRYRLKPLFNKVDEWIKIATRVQQNHFKRLRIDREDSSHASIQLGFEEHRMLEKSGKHESYVYIPSFFERYLEENLHLGFLRGRTPTEDAGEEASNDNNEGEEVVKHLETPLPNRTTASVTEIILASKYCAAAGFRRYLGQSLRCIDGKIYAAPLADKTLGIVHQVNPMPLPNRSLDTVPLFLRGHLYQIGKLAPFGERLCAPSGSRDVDFSNLCFWSILLRTTGRVSRYQSYRMQRTKDNSPESGGEVRNGPQATGGCKGILPMPAQVDDLLKFIKDTLPAGKPSMSWWLSQQHGCALATSMKNYFGMKIFLRNVAERVDGIVNGILNKRSTTYERKEAINDFEKFLGEACGQGGEGKKLHFLAQQIVQDMEEFYDYPFGPPVATDVTPGFGGKEGYKVMKNGDRSLKTLAMALEKIVGEINSLSMSDDLMEVDGWTRTEGDSVFRSKLNGRPFSYPDAEHVLCKCYVMASYTLAGRRFSNCPMSDKCHCHPVRFPNDAEVPWDDATIRLHIITPGLAKYEDLVKKGKIELPDFCKLPGEP